jgi:hypothetical protein
VEPNLLAEQTAASESTSPIEPVVEPVNGAVARDSGLHGFSPDNASEVSATVPAEEVTSSDSNNSLTEDQPIQQPNDQRQPA